MVFVSYNYGMNYPGQNPAAYGAQQGYGQQVKSLQVAKIMNTKVVDFSSDLVIFGCRFQCNLWYLACPACLPAGYIFGLR